MRINRRSRTLYELGIEKNFRLGPK